MSHASAAARTWDAVVIGAGPAGAMAGRELARRGAQVLMVERRRFPRDKVCGACLNGRALGLLEQAGLGALAGALGAVPLVQFRLWAAGRHARLPLPGGAVVSRARLDAALVRAAVEAGAVFLPGTSAALSGSLGAERSVHVESEAPPLGSPPTDSRGGGTQSAVVSARVVIVAGGLGAGTLFRTNEIQDEPSPGAWIGMGGTSRPCPSWCRPGEIHMAVGRGGYVGLARQEDDSLNVAAALAPGLLRAHGPGAAVDLVLRQAGLAVAPGTVPSAWRGTLPLTRRTSPVAAHRVFVIGDAAGYVEPFTGEGIAWALGSGMAVAPYALQGCRRWNPELPKKWAAAYRKIVVRRQQWCRLAVSVLHRPRLVDAGIRAIQVWPGLAGRLAGRILHGG